MISPTRTPLRKNLAIANPHLSTPLLVPPSPQLQQLGYGTGVHVYRIERSLNVGKIRSPWVIKRLRGRTTENDDGEMIASRLKFEADILRQLDHPNIVGFRGSKVMPNQQVVLAMENCDTSLGNVVELRSEESLGPLESHKILKMSRDICSALDYLHTTAHILHGDLKSFNILIKGDFDLCKLCDFGVSQPLNDEGYLDVENKPDAQYTGTNLWSAPEVFDSPSNEISYKADLFSFGLVLYECIALQAPHCDHLFEKEPDQSVEGLQPKALFNKTIDSNASENDENQTPNTGAYNELDESAPTDPLEPYLGTRPLIPDQYDLPKDYNPVVEIFLICTKELAEDRPEASTLVTFLTAIAK